jgi:hypothetical protein
MRNALKIIVAIACMAAAPSVALATTATSSGKPFAINCYKEQFKPKRITIACGDAGIWLSKLKWSSWGSANAKGAGTYNQNDCTPDCADGKIKSYPVDVTLSKPKSCPGQTQLAFKRAALTFTGALPPGPGAGKLTFRCPVLPGEY